MRLLPSSREFQAIYADALRLAEHVAPDWTYREDDDFGAALLQLGAYFSDHLHYRADAVQRDVAPTRTPHAEVAREFAEWLGYLARRPTPAEVGVVFSVESMLPEDLPVARGHRISGTGPDGTVTFEVFDDVVLDAGSTSIAVHVVEGVTSSDVLLGTATGRPLERFQIPDADVIFNWADDDLVVTVGGAEAQHYRFPALMTGGVLGYWARQSVSGPLELRFGDGLVGARLPVGAQVRCTYRRGGGTRGNVGAGALRTVVTGSTLLDGTEVTLRVTNPLAASPGFPAETLASIRTSAPAAFASQNRCVTTDDYLSAVLAVPGVFRARVATSGISGVRVLLVAAGATEGSIGSVTPELRARVVREVGLRKMMTDDVTAEAARLVVVDVTLAVRARRGMRNGACREGVRAQFIGRRVQPDGSVQAGLFVADSNDLGRTLFQSDMAAVVEAVPQVDNFDVLRYCRRPVLRWESTEGNAALSAAGVTVGATTRAQEWRVEMVSDTEFIVTGSLSGLQSTLGVLGTAFSDDLAEVSFRIVAGSQPMAEGDRGVIAVGELVGNIGLAEDEFPVFDSQSVIIRVTGGLGA